MTDTSRDPALLEPQLRAAWEYGKAEYERLYPHAAQPFLTATYRGPLDQQRAFEAGRSRARFGESLHNYEPAYAFDVAFLRPDGGLDWTPVPFERLAAILKPLGLQWGGDWPGLVDGPHHQLPMSLADARVGRVPTLPPLPSVSRRVLVLQDAAGENHSFDIPGDMDVLVRVTDRDRVYVTIK